MPKKFCSKRDIAAYMAKNNRKLAKWPSERPTEEHIHLRSFVQQLARRAGITDMKGISSLTLKDELKNFLTAATKEASKIVTEKAE
jgi:hypothetical protein